MRSRLRRVAGPCSPISGDVVADWPQAWRRNVAMGANFRDFSRPAKPIDACRRIRDRSRAGSLLRRVTKHTNQYALAKRGCTNNHDSRMAIVLTTFPGRDGADCHASLGRKLFVLLARKPANRAISLAHGRKRVAAFFPRSSVAFCAFAWLRCPSSGCVFLTTPAVKGASVRR